MIRKIGLGLLVLLVLAFVALNALAWSGALVDVDAATTQRPTAMAPEVAEPATEPITWRRQSGPISSEKAGLKAKRGAVTLNLAATRGDYWVEVRARSATGPPLYSGTLAAGKTLRFDRSRLWLRLGAASNLDIMVNGRPLAVPFGTVELTVPDT
jgi:Domain of unknown function (DUF4115)